MNQAPKVAAIAGNGAFILRFPYHAGVNLADVQAVFPAARHNYPFFTFDGDQCLQVQMSNEAAYAYGLSHGAPFSMLRAGA